MRFELLLALVAISCSSLQVNCNPVTEYPNDLKPVRTAAEDEIVDLPGLNESLNFKQYSGFLDVDEDGEGKIFFHYWFVESQSNPAQDPVMLWLDGGPGCSSIGTVFKPSGPFRVNADLTLSTNRHSLNRVANVLYLSSPINVGFSYANKRTEVQGDDSTALRNHLALKAFMDKFPQYRLNPLYLSGESYAGIYLPLLGVLIDQDKDFNLKGIAVSNGYFDHHLLVTSRIFYAYYHGLIGESIMDEISVNCCNGQPPTRKSCKFSGEGVPPKCDYTAAKALQMVFESGLDVYNLFGEPAKPGREDVDKTILGYAPHRYLKLDQVRKAIHIPREAAPWVHCTRPMTYFEKYPYEKGGVSAQFKQLIESDRKLTMLVFNGNFDWMCDFLGDGWFVHDLGQKLLRDSSPWRANGRVAGFVTQYDGITFATVHGTGHTPYSEKDLQNLRIYERFFRSETQNVEL